jgi:hypothetical protein
MHNCKAAGYSVGQKNGKTIGNSYSKNCPRVIGEQPVPFFSDKGAAVVRVIYRFRVYLPQADYPPGPDAVKIEKPGPLFVGKIFGRTHITGLSKRKDHV